MLVFIRGAGDLATGISIRLYRAGISVCHSDLAIPTAVRRNVAFSEAIRLGECSVEGITAVRAESLEEIRAAISQKKYLWWWMRERASYTDYSRMLWWMLFLPRRIWEPVWRMQDLLSA